MPRSTPIRYTGVRQEQFLSLQAMRRSIPAATYQEALAEINRRQAIANTANERSEAKKDAAAIKKAMGLKAKATERKAKASAAAKAKRRAAITTDPRFIAAYDFNAYDPLDTDEVYAITDKADGKFEITLYVNRRRKRVVIFNLTGVPAGNRYTDLRRDFLIWRGSDTRFSVFNATVSDKPLNDSDKIAIVIRRVSEPIDPGSIIQHFADGKAHCVAEPLARIWDERAATARANGSAPATIKTCEKRARACRAYGMEYADGIPEGAPMERMAQVAHRRIIIHDILDNVYATYNATCSHIARFTNTREHHLDIDRISLDSEAIEVTGEEMEDLVHAHHNQHYLFQGTIDHVKALRSARGCWRVKSVLHDKYVRHDEANRTKQARIDARLHPELNAYLRASRNVCSAPVRIGEGVADGMLDMKSAYTQHAATSYYAGFPGKVHQWRRLPPGYGRAFVAAHFGIYKIRIIKNENPVLITLGLTGCHILPGPEILYYFDQGVEMELLSAVFMTAKADITYAPEMFEVHETEDGKGKAYQWWAGCQGHDEPNRAFRFKGSQLWANHLAAQFGAENVGIADGIITLNRPKAYWFTNHHTLAFITSYCRINVLEAVNRIKNPLVIQLDAIFYSGAEEEFGPFVHKEGECPSPRASSVWFYDRDIDDSFMPMLEDERLLSHCVLAGAGGTGKTHAILTDKGFNDVCYVVPQHDLGKAKKDDYGLEFYTTYNKIAGIPFGDKPTRSMAEEGYFHAVLLFEEGTMVEADWVKKAIADHPDALYLFCGDVERRADGSIMALQCRNGRPGAFSTVFNPPTSWGWRVSTTDYRSRLADGSPDEELIAFKQQLRAWMREVYTDGGPIDARRIYSKLIASGRPIIKQKDALPMFSEGDTWIAGTNSTSLALLRAGVCSGWSCKAGPEKGSKSFVEVKGWEKRGSFTTHSFQGQTVTKGKLFVTISDGFEHAMLYTAISRATRMDQIVLVT